jgi:hypothetical protein
MSEPEEPGKPGVMLGEPVDLSRPEYVEVTITRDRVYVHTERGLMFRAYKVGKIHIKDQRTTTGEN